MASATSISEKINRITAKTADTKTFLAETATVINEETGISLYFCEIIGGRRWSWCAGNEDLLPAPRRIPLTDRYGMVIGTNTAFDDTVSTKIVPLLTRLLKARYPTRSGDTSEY